MTDPLHNPQNSFEDRLSPQGRARARAMQDELLAHVDRRRYRRHAVQIGSGFAALCTIFVAVTASRVAPTLPSSTNFPPIARATPVNPPSHPVRAAFAILETDTHALARYSIATTGPTLVRNLTDEQLLASFRADGVSMALIRVNGRTHLAQN